MPALTSATGSDWLKLLLAWYWLKLARLSPTAETVRMSHSCVSDLWLVGFGGHHKLIYHPLKALIRKPGIATLPTPDDPTLSGPVFPPSLPFVSPNGLGDGLYFTPQKHIIFFSTAGYSICKRLVSEVLWISITAEVPLVSQLLLLRGGALDRRYSLVAEGKKENRLISYTF